MNRYVLLITVSLILGATTGALAQGTAFSYEGRLNDGANPANGSYDLRFALFDSASSGTQQGNTITNTATAVNNGLFAVTLDFGPQFSGADRWLEISVRTNGSGGFTMLSPGQALMPTPYAIHAASAGSVAGSGRKCPRPPIKPTPRTSSSPCRRPSETSFTGSGNLDPTETLQAAFPFWCPPFATSLLKPVRHRQ